MSLLNPEYPRESRGGGAWKWLVGLAGVAVVAAVVVAVMLRSDAQKRRKQIAELTRTAQSQSQAGDYPAAWSSLVKALNAAEPGGMLDALTRLSVEAQQVRTAQEDLAMNWIDDLHVDANEKYSPMVDQIAPALMSGAATATGTRKANLLAHDGWAAFYKSLDGAAIGDLASQYRAALAEDATNPYAHAFLGHWIAWSGGSLNEAMKEFNAAVASNRGTLFVRRVQREALRKRGQEADPALIAVATDMRKNGETIEPSLRTDLDTAYSFACGARENADDMREFLAAVPAIEQVVTFRRLFYDHAGRPLDPARELPHDACLATLLEAAGQREDALQVWRRLRKAIGTNTASPLTTRADAAIRRLKAK